MFCLMPRALLEGWTCLDAVARGCVSNSTHVKSGLTPLALSLCKMLAFVIEPVGNTINSLGAGCLRSWTISERLF